VPVEELRVGRLAERFLGQAVEVQIHARLAVPKLTVQPAHASRALWLRYSPEPVTSGGRPFQSVRVPRAGSRGAWSKLEANTLATGPRLLDPALQRRAPMHGQSRRQYTRREIPTASRVQP